METSAAAQAIEVLIQDYGKLVFHVIYGLTHHQQESEDLTQETFLQAFRGIESARAASGPGFQAKAWLMRIALNTVRMQRRRQKAQRILTFADLQPGQQMNERSEEIPALAYEEIPAGDDLEATLAERDTVQRCLARLPETLRLPLLLSIVGGFSSHDLSEILSLHEATVRQRLSRARKAFQRLYAQESGETVQDGLPVACASATSPRSRDHFQRNAAALTFGGL